jgi:glycosyltransferase involved in cell wall biosynthesis
VGGHRAPGLSAAAPELMRILIFHGYLLGGTGSNVYNARLARTLVQLGHEVHLLCQERHPEQVSFLDAAGDWDHGSLRLRALSEGPARCTLYRPRIGGLLPVYVKDSYEGVQARTFADCSEAEVGSYIEANVAAVREVAALARPHIALANHLVMGPAILARALEGQIPYAVKVHGSALEYTVKPDLPRFLPYAREGVAGASGVLVGSRHTAESLWEALGEEWVAERDLRTRTRLGPPGVDIHAFGPRDRVQATAGLRSLVRRLSAGQGAARDVPATPPGPQVDVFARDDARAAEALAGLDPADGPIVVFVGKLIVSKGVDLLLAAWPLVLERVPSARLLIVGFGAFQDALEAMVGHLAAGELGDVGDIARAGRALEGGAQAPLVHLQAFLEALRRDGVDRYLAASVALGQSVRFTGRLDHDELVDLLPVCEAAVVPSTFPEAFGMVAVEAAACGLLPISAAHSGLAEVSERLAGAVGYPVANWLSFPVDEDVVQAIADRVIAWLTAPQPARERAVQSIVETVCRLWSWEGVAEGVIAAAEGRLAELPGASRSGRG